MSIRRNVFNPLGSKCDESMQDCRDKKPSSSRRLGAVARPTSYRSELFRAYFSMAGFRVGLRRLAPALFPGTNYLRFGKANMGCFCAYVYLRLSGLVSKELTHLLRAFLADCITSIGVPCSSESLTIIGRFRSNQEMRCFSRSSLKLSRSAGRIEPLAALL
jgi:hypothetical protein